MSDWYAAKYPGRYRHKYLDASVKLEYDGWSWTGDRQKGFVPFGADDDILGSKEKAKAMALAALEQKC